MKNPLADLAPGQIHKGMVKKILKTGVVINIGHVNGFLNTRDMRWSPIKDPCEMVEVGQEIEVLIINADSAKNIKLGLKQIQNIPWELAITTYPIGSRHVGTVINITSRYTYIRLESNYVGRSGVYKPKMSSTHNSSPQNISIDERVEVEVISFNTIKKIINFSIKKPNAEWKAKADQIKTNDLIEGSVVALYSCFSIIEINKGLFGLLYIDNMSWLHINKPAELLKIGEVIKCLILDIDYEKCKIHLGLKQLLKNPWDEYIPNRYQLGTIIKGTITSSKNYGLFIELEPGLLGLLHNSELMAKDIEPFKKNLIPGEKLDVCIINVDTTKRRIGLGLNISTNIIH